MTEHNIEPVFDRESKILILGSFPSVRSRETGFFYGHPQNRFWRVVSTVCGEAVPETIPAKRDFLLRNYIALWDVIASCDIVGSSDSSIKNVVPNDLSTILDEADITDIYVNGRTAEKLYNRYTKHVCKRECICLPSTSPANAAWSFDRLIETWKCSICTV
ncbi:MAG: DNA-deoxyinosine glycosylase [Lachnospiraceae bacterium]|nr:DNA-deoxyinosine glycosylase [Lachnospiraceae bacterium]